jgi:DNA-binding response OmpR family regulator
MVASQILVVDDEAKIRFLLERVLSQEGYEIDTAADGAEAMRKLSQASYDLLLLDLYMEPIHGVEVLNFAREQDPNLAIIILTAYSSVESAVEALRLDAFDYLFKPASPETIRQRVKEGLEQRTQMLRHHQLLSQIDNLHQTFRDMVTETEHKRASSAQQRFVRAGNLTIDRQHHLVTLSDNLLKLTTAEYDLLLCLVKASPGLLSPRQLVNQALGYDCNNAEARDIIKWHIHHLRKKIEPDPAHPRYIKTVRHKGYMWRGE